MDLHGLWGVDRLTNPEELKVGDRVDWEDHPLSNWRPWGVVTKILDDEEREELDGEYEVSIKTLPLSRYNKVAYRHELRKLPDRKEG